MVTVSHRRFKAIYRELSSSKRLEAGFNEASDDAGRCNMKCVRKVEPGVSSTFERAKMTLVPALSRRVGAKLTDTSRLDSN